MAHQTTGEKTAGIDLLVVIASWKPHHDTSIHQYLPHRCRLTPQQPLVINSRPFQRSLANINLPWSFLQQLPLRRPISQWRKKLDVDISFYSFYFRFFSLGCFLTVDHLRFTSQLLSVVHCFLVALGCIQWPFSWVTCCRSPSFWDM